MLAVNYQNSISPHDSDVTILTLFYILIAFFTFGTGFTYKTFQMARESPDAFQKSKIFEISNDALLD